MSKNYKWLSVKEICELMVSPLFDNGGAIHFTADDYESNCEDQNFEPTGWYGIARTGCFDGAAIIWGYFGGGIDGCVNLGAMECPEYELVSLFLPYLKDEGGSWITEDTMLCIDANYPNEY